MLANDPEKPGASYCQKQLFQSEHQQLINQSVSLLKILQQLAIGQPAFQRWSSFFKVLCNTLYQHFETEKQLLFIWQEPNVQIANYFNSLSGAPYLAELLWSKEGEHAYLQGQLLYFQQQLISLSPHQADIYIDCLQQLERLKQSLQAQIDEEQRLVFPHLLAQQANWQGKQLKVAKKC